MLYSLEKYNNNRAAYYFFQLFYVFLSFNQCSNMGLNLLGYTISQDLLLWGNKGGYLSSTS